MTGRLSEQAGAHSEVVNCEKSKMMVNSHTITDMKINMCDKKGGESAFLEDGRLTTEVKIELDLVCNAMVNLTKI